MQKSDALAICKACNNLWGRGCDFGLIEGAKSEDIDPPACLKALLQSAPKPAPAHSASAPQTPQIPAQTAPKVAPTNERTAPPHDQKEAQPHRQAQKTDMREDAPPKTQKLRPPKYTGLPSWWDELDEKIIHAVMLCYHRNGIISTTGAPPSTVRRRLDRLTRHRIIKPTPQKMGGWACVTYTILDGWAQKLIHNEGVRSALEFKITWHALSFKSEILGGARPKGDRSYQPNNWKVPGEVFYGDGFSIRLTPKYAIVDIHQDLGADTEADLLLKYHTLALKYLGQFSERYKIQLAPFVQQNREPHRAVPESHDIAQQFLGPMGGELYSKELGAQVDESDEQHRGELEFVGPAGKQTASTLSSFMAQVPVMTTIIQSQMGTVKERQELITQKVNTLETGLHQISKGIQEMQAFLVQEKQIQELKAQKEEYRVQVEQMAKELQAIRQMIGTGVPTQPRHEKPDKWGYAMYG